MIDNNDTDALMRTLQHKNLLGLELQTLHQATSKTEFVAIDSVQVDHKGYRGYKIQNALLRFNI
jgi:hypothetical protein